MLSMLILGLVVAGAVLPFFILKRSSRVQRKKALLRDLLAQYDLELPEGAIVKSIRTF